MLISKLNYAVTDEVPLTPGRAEGGKGGSALDTMFASRTRPATRRAGGGCAGHAARSPPAVPTVEPPTGPGADDATTMPTTDPVLSRPWNQRPRDVANLVHQIRGSLEESYLNWQIVTLGTPLDDMHEGPVLFISGNRELEFTPGQQAS